MLKKLRTKLVCIIMGFSVILLLVIFALIMVFTGIGLKRESESVLQTLGDMPMRPDDRPGMQENVNLPYIVIEVSQRGNISSAGNGYFDTSDEEYIVTLLQDTMAEGGREGQLGEYGLRYRRVNTPGGEKFVFVDISGHREMMQRLALSCLMIGCVSIALLLALSIALGNWAVRPVEEAWKQQKQFVADASHELKTPLAVIMSNAELLQSSEYREEEKLRFSGNIYAVSQQMRRLVDGMLDLARLDKGVAEAGFSQVDLSGLVEEELLPFEPLFFEKGLSLSASVEQGIGIQGSESHLKQVLDILLDNALKYASLPSEVAVRLVRSGGNCILTVVSAGEAISREDLTNIFRRFYRVNSARSRDGSYGLGLSIAQSIVDKHGGKIWAESNGGFNTFAVQLPIK